MPTATIDVPMPGAVGVQFVKETPKLNGRNVTVEFVTSGPTDTVICQLGSYSVTEDCKCVLACKTLLLS